MYLNTMSTPVRHPWFDKPSLKRKFDDPACPPPKRRRASTLERGFASLTLDAAMLPVDALLDEPPQPRPVTPTVPEITMKTSSWYEPEPDRIVVTDLDSTSDDEVDEDAHPLISTALLDRLKTRPLQPTLPPQPDSQALVLFRPLMPPPPRDKDADADTRADALTRTHANADKYGTDSIDNDDAMDV
ncbi:hypothetical protein DFH09DRAFT_1163325, partial [Mycena vulgaris]